jgi:hypothetical protein
MAPPKVLVSKLKQLKADLIRWNKEVFGNVEVQKKFLLEEIQTLDGLKERELAADERARIEKARNDLAEVALMQEINWRQNLGYLS